eukprot:Sspe_Gene.72537::Locus_43356_Transcript_1_1_Confidence_1.000_Length_2947::g.72537::m.72537
MQVRAQPASMRAGGDGSRSYQKRSLSLPTVGSRDSRDKDGNSVGYGSTSNSIIPLSANHQKRDIVLLVKSVKAHFRNSMLCRDGLMVVQTRIFDEGGRECFHKFILNSTGGLSVLLASMEHHLSDNSVIEVAAHLLCNVCYYGGRRQPRVIAKVIKKGGSKIAVNVLNVHKASSLKIFQAMCTIICAIAITDPKIATIGRLSGCLSTLLTIIKTANGVKEVLVGALSSLCALTGRCDQNIALLVKKGAIPLLAELCQKPATRQGQPVVMRFTCKALLSIAKNEENVLPMVKEGIISSMMLLLAQPCTVELLKLVLDILKSCIGHPSGREQFNALGGSPTVVESVMAVNGDKTGEQLLEIVLHLFKFHDLCDLPLVHEEEVDFPFTTNDGDSMDEAGSQEVDDGPDMPCPSTFCPELSPGGDPACSTTATADSTLHVRPFTAPRPSPSCTSGIEYIPSCIEPLHVLPPAVKTDIIKHQLKRLTSPHLVLNEVVYDDVPRSTAIPTPPASLETTDLPMEVPPLTFSSHFECGNLKRAIRIYEAEYDLILNSDINSAYHTQWFYFSVENMIPGKPYRFNIINLEKPTSLFNEGQRPVVFSEKEFTKNGIGWQRDGSHILYMRNAYKKREPLVRDVERVLSSDKRRSKQKDDNEKVQQCAMKKLDTRSQGCYFTLTFTLTFPHPGDRVYLAHSYPYTYSDLQRYLKGLPGLVPQLSDFYTNQVLSRSVGDNLVNLLTITTMQEGGVPVPVSEIQQRKVIAVSARVHPGETVASWMVKGLIDYLIDPTSKDAKYLRDNFVWKIVPMLNPDGVVNGNHRCSLTCRDLNREWYQPSATVSPPIFHLKRLMKHIKFQQGRQFMLFCDFHGHSRKRDFFMYGCNLLKKNTPITPLTLLERVLPRLLGDTQPSFSYDSSSFKVQKAKESAGRVVVWRELGVRMSYTLEASMMGGTLHSGDSDDP